MLEERKRPSSVLLAMTIAPAPLLLLIWFLTEGFSLRPSLPHIFSKIAPMVLAILSIIIAIFTFNLAKDEEPEWGPALPFKVIEGAAIAYVVLAVIFLLLIASTYFLP
ncbi:MAG: hypothetical protein DRK00_05390 [Thermoprotei archaeon]|nr:MAG: hypothetical protein DRK00_05390 [Thermoprotei archaeon]